VTVPSVLNDNPHLPGDYKQQIEAATATDEELRKAWCDGNWFIQRGAFFSHVFDENRNVVPAWPHLPEAGALDGLKPWQVRNVQANAKFMRSNATFGWSTFIALDHGSAAIQRRRPAIGPVADDFPALAPHPPREAGHDREPHGSGARDRRDPAAS
jgi:hypothetical protein